MPRRALGLVAALALAISCTAAAPTVEPAPAKPTHVIVVGLDNYHGEDVQRAMPNLWGFLQQGAWTLNTHHTVLPTRTAPGFASIASGQYPDRHGAIYNSFQAPAGTARVGFAYWENLAKLSPPPFLSDPPWVAFNKAGYDVGAIGWQGLVIENKQEAQGLIGREPTAAELDRYWGLAVHRKDGKAEIGTADIRALREVAPDGWLNGWAGPPLKSASITLPLATALLRSGVPVVFAYVENTHQRCTGTTPQSCGGNLGKGSFDDLLKADDAAFGAFFADLTKLGITTANSLFVITTDEEDHYLDGYAKVIDTTELQPAVNGAAGLFYGAGADALGEALKARTGIQAIATKAAMKAVHIPTSDARTPTYVAFSDPDFYFNRGACSNCGRWNHGTINPDINDFWIGFVGAGVKPGKLGAFTDHPDIVATVRYALGVPPTPDLDGVPVFPALSRRTSDDVLAARDAYKQVNAPLGSFGAAILKLSTAGVRGGPDARTKADARIVDLVARRDAIVTELRGAIDGSAPRTSDAIKDLVKRANALIDEAGR